MIQQKRFLNRVYKTSSDEFIEAGDPVVFILQDHTGRQETVTEADRYAYWVKWNSSANKTRQEDVVAVSSAHNGSVVSGDYYLDADGNPILDADGNPIPLPT